MHSSAVILSRRFWCYKEMRAISALKRSIRKGMEVDVRKCCAVSVEPGALGWRAFQCWIWEIWQK